MNQPINIKTKLAQFDSLWTPHIIAELNGQQVKLAKLEGEFAWHDHANEDELFFVITGQLTMQERGSDGTVTEVVINPGEMYIVPRGVEHNPVAEPGTAVMLIEPAATKHTGEQMLEQTVINQSWI